MNKAAPSRAVAFGQALVAPATSSSGLTLNTQASASSTSTIGPPGTQTNVSIAATLSFRLLIALFLLALAVRAGWGVVRLARAEDAATLEFPDERQYWAMSRALRAGNGLHDEFGFRATRMPLYPAFLSLFRDNASGVVAAKCTQWALGALIAPLAALLAAAINRRAGPLAGLWAAFDPFLIFFSSLLLTETVFIVSLTFLWLLAMRVFRKSESGSLWAWAWLGIAASACIYLRESSVGLTAFLLGLLLLSQQCRPSAIGGTFLAGGLILLCLYPWAARNRYVTGEWCWLTHRAGISLYDGVRPSAEGRSDLAAVQQMDAVRGLSEANWNDYFIQESWALMRQDPGRIARLAWIKWGRLWNPIPNVDTYRSGTIRIVSAAWMVPTYLCAVLGLCVLPRMNNGSWLAALLLLPAAYFTAVHAFFVGSVRYRLPAMPMIGVLAAIGVAWLMIAVRRDRETSGGDASNSE